MPSLASRVTVIKMYALSRVYYVGSILPVTKTMVKKFESCMGKFIWSSSGWMLRVALEEVKNAPLKGGLGLVCLTSMCNSLLLSQFLRLLKSECRKTLNHIRYWIGDFLADILPGIDDGDHAAIIPNYFEDIVALILKARVDDLVTIGGWRTLTNKMIYTTKSNEFPVVKIERDMGISFQRVWNLLWSPVLSASTREVSYLLVHNKLHVKERLHRFGLSSDPYCDICSGNIVCDAEHVFCSCDRVLESWTWVKRKVEEIIGADIENVKLINFFVPVHNNEIGLVWLLASYYEYVWSELQVKNKDSSRFEQFFGYLTFKYRMDTQGARPWFYIPGLNQQFT